MKAKNNPFSVDRVLKVKYKLTETEWEKLLVKLKQLNFSAAIIGQHGNGKTTLLDTLGERLLTLNLTPKRLQLNTDNPNFPKNFLRDFSASLEKNDVILFDGAEQLNFIFWQYFKYKVRFAKGLVITTHFPGRLPTLYKCETNYQILEDVLFELVGIEAKNLKPSSKELFDKHKGNIRDILREYYDIYANTT